MDKRADDIKSRDFASLVLESMAHYAVFTLNKERVISSWNRGAEKVLLYRSDEILGRSGDILYTKRDRLLNVPEVELATALREGVAIDERFHLKKGDVKFWSTGLVFPLYDDENQHIGFTKVMRNISEEQEAEKNLREEQGLAHVITSYTENPVVILNSGLEVVAVSNAFVKFLSLTKRELIGRGFYEIMDGGVNLAELKAALEKALKGHQFFSDFEVSCQSDGEQKRSMMVKLRRIYQPPNQLLKLEFEDRTKIHQLLKEKDEFISIAAHEVKTPISIIKAYGQILDRQLKNTSPEVKRALDRINEQINNLTSLTAALLDTTKITTGNMVLEPEIFNLDDLVMEAIESFRVSHTSHQFSLDCHVDAIVNADKMRIRAVLMNLLTNAVKYSPGANKVVICMETNEGDVKVSVQDFGIGIPEKEQDNIFKKFGRAESVRRSSIPGFGLGLHLSNEIIEMHDGKMGFDTKEGQGSTFYFTLPLY